MVGLAPPRGRPPNGVEAAVGAVRDGVPRGQCLLVVAHCHLGLGTLDRRTGDAAKATDHLTTAATMYGEMGMTFWLEKADAELGGVAR